MFTVVEYCLLGRIGQEKQVWRSLSLVYHLIQKKKALMELKWILQNFSWTLVKSGIGNLLMRENKDCWDVRKMWHRWWRKGCILIVQFTVTGSWRSWEVKQYFKVMITRIGNRLILMEKRRKFLLWTRFVFVGFEMWCFFVNPSLLQERPNSSYYKLIIAFPTVSMWKIFIFPWLYPATSKCSLWVSSACANQREFSHIFIYTFKC